MLEELANELELAEGLMRLPDEVVVVVVLAVVLLVPLGKPLAFVPPPPVLPLPKPLLPLPVACWRCRIYVSDDLLSRLFAAEVDAE